MPSPQDQLEARERRHHQDAGVVYLSPASATPAAPATISPPPSYANESLFSHSLTQTTAPTSLGRSSGSLPTGQDGKSGQGESSAPPQHPGCAITKSSSLPVLVTTHSAGQQYESPPSAGSNIQDSVPGRRMKSDASAIELSTDALCEALRLHDEVAQLRNELLQVRSGLAYERRVYEVARQYAEDSITQLMDALRKSAERPRGAEHDLLECGILQRQASSDFTIQQTQSDHLKSLEGTMYSLEDALGHAEATFMRTVQGALGSFESATVREPALSEIVQHGQTTAGRSPTIPKELIIHWDVLGEVDMLEEQLHELELGREQEVLELSRQLEQQDSPTDEKLHELNDRYLREKQKLLNRLHDNKALVERSRSDCIEKGIDPDTPRKVPSESSSGQLPEEDASAPAAGFTAMSEPLLGIRRVPNIYASEGRATSRFFVRSQPLSESDSRARIESWLADAEHTERGLSSRTRSTSQPAGPAKHTTARSPRHSLPDLRKSLGFYEDRQIHLQD